MFPFRDHNPSRNKPYVNWVLIAINIIVFLSYIPILNDDYAISSFFAATPSRDYAYALLQNFRNKICLSTEDPLTIEYLSKLTGMAKTRKKSFSFSFQSSSSQTISEARDHVLEAQVFRSLSPDSALAILSIDNKSSDDALKLFPIFLEDKNSNSSNEK